MLWFIIFSSKNTIKYLHATFSLIKHFFLYCNCLLNFNFRFEKDKRLLPVLWHQCFLAFVQRYKEYLSSEQKEALQALLRVHLHQQITPEIRRELMNSKCRDQIMQEESSGGTQMET